MATDLILGTAGHIDHGKTALIRALTGTDTDRLPEEKRRGITIELGFAQLPVTDPDGNEFRLGVVDVPGHEKFVRQMLAGATGMDVALLVVAADDSVKPQTREHVEVLRMLDIHAGVIALTKCDLADPDWVELVEAEVRDLVSDSFLADAPIVQTSVVTNQGIDDLRSELAKAAGLAAAGLSTAVIEAPFRMAIDRAFTLAGHGAVVTGSVVSGRVNVGDELEIQPGAIAARVRSLQNHDEAVESVQRGQRAAINIAGIHHDQIERGHELAAVGHLHPSQLITAKIHQLPSAPRPLKPRDNVRVHIGTAEVLATVALLDRTVVQPGESAIAQLFLRKPIVSVWKQPFVLRCESPVETIGGGQILVPSADKMRRVTEEQLKRLKDLLADDLPTRAAAALHFHGLSKWKDADLVNLAGIPDGKTIISDLLADGQLISLQVSPTRTALLEKGVYESWSDRFVSSLERLHEQSPLRSRLDRSQLLARLEYVQDRPLLNAIVDTMAAEGKIKSSDAGIALATHKAKLSARQMDAFEAIVASFREQAFQPPSEADCQKLAPGHEKDIEKLLRLAVSDGQLVHIEKQLYLHAEVAEEMRQTLTEKMQGGEGMTLSAIRELLGTTRKYAVPICEYLDRTGFTKRSGDLRVLA